MSEQSADIMSRLDAAIGGEALPEVAPQAPEAEDQSAEVEAEQAVEPSDEPETEESQPEEQAEDENPAAEVVEVEYEGEVFKVPPKLKDALMRQQDYTVKTQHLAEQRRATEDRSQYLEAKEVLLGAAYEEAAEYRAIQKQLEQFDALDWARLAQQDMQQAYTLDLQRQELRRQLEGKQQALQQKVAQIEQARKMHLEKQLELGRAELQRRIGPMKAEDVQATWKQGQSLGFSEQELSTITDPRVMHAIYKAAQWDKLQAGKKDAQQKVSKAPPVVKPGATKGAGAMEAAAFAKQRQALKKSGKLDDAAAILNRMLK